MKLHGGDQFVPKCEVNLVDQTFQCINGKLRVTCPCELKAEGSIVYGESRF